MKAITFLAFFLLATISFGQNQDQFEKFNPSDYPIEKFQITSDSIKFKDLIIEIRQVRDLSYNDQFGCRAWLTIEAKSKSIYQRYFKSIEAVGSCYGLFIPLEQPRQDYFILSKLGDYDGRIFIIDSNGNVIEKLGGPFYISNDKRYLFSEYYSDLSGLTVFDFNTGQCLFSDTIAPNLFEWYYKDDRFISRVDLLNNRISPDVYYYFDLATRKLISFKQKEDYLKPDDRLASYNDKNTRRFCNCGLELLLKQN